MTRWQRVKAWYYGVRFAVIDLAAAIFTAPPKERIKEIVVGENDPRFEKAMWEIGFSTDPLRYNYKINDEPSQT